ncbi:hypothetical protein SMACR_08537 [Sordaria macrospora]|uniref:WGS project CABT00000000 data, contig 2.59 n=2 Tax=Sordaria macrospora TaxID=5147 RepID=F7WA91_SORMK|nr:uncharacterized protein SMAC_08537 [Sordaria macrospora k-hell]KAA8635581.1 hypothetical protein SMACR_08537 [Sordaria macrospora]KAH7629450.1 hypothetical protein B0T09DRAFT_343077 [Sordaria sp. MPI-SDFR-AT-0083]WPJ66326.1 hypothetical protein SMAC4_08537 [Sordaria macrospora]CCC05285.1 unnamed protein product [Sordaria macrospora k-hell]
MDESHPISTTNNGGSSMDTATIQPSDIPTLVEAMMETVFKMIHHGVSHRGGGGHKPPKSRHENLNKAIENITPVALDIVLESISEEQGSPYNPTVKMKEALKAYIALWLRNKMTLQ